MTVEGRLNIIVRLKELCLSSGKTVEAYGEGFKKISKAFQISHYTVQETRL